ASNGIVKSLAVTPLEKGPANGWVPDSRERAAAGETVSTGKNAARENRTAARAWRNCAWAALRVWLETVTCSSRALSDWSPKTSHHFPRSVESLGWAAGQLAFSL